MNSDNNSDSNDTFYSANSSSSESYSDACDLDVLLNNSLACPKKHFNACHINAQSVPAHYTDLLTTFASPATIHAILISETWLKPSLLSTCYSIPGYVLLRNDRIGAQGGGVAIYLRADVTYKIVCCSSGVYSGSPEYLFVEVVFSGIKHLVGVVYCPPTINYFTKLEAILEETASQYSHHVVMGDFNTCLINKTPVYASRASKLSYIISANNLSILPTGPTHHLPSSSSLLDLIITSRPDLATYGQLPAASFSHHDLLFLSYKSKPPKYHPTTISLRNFSLIDLDKLRSEAASIDWSALYTVDDIDTKVQTLTREVLELYDRHAPVHIVKLRRPPAPWINDEIRHAMRKRDKAYRRYRKNRCEECSAQYRVARNRCNQLCRTAKRRYFHKSIKDNSPSQNWRFLKSVGFGKSHSNVSNFNNITPDQLNTFFSSVPALSHMTKTSVLADLNDLPIREGETFTFGSVSIENTAKAIRSITSKAVGTDAVGRAMIIPILDTLLPPVTHIINFSLSTGNFPTSWREAIVIPLPKITSPTLINHYRPISILPFFSKVLEYIAFKQFSAFLITYNLFNPFQSGFRPGHSTTTALLKVTEDIRVGMEDTKLTILVLIDFSNAFGMVDADLLGVMLRNLNLSSESLNWFSEYLHGRRQRVKAGGDVSDWCTLSVGLPQGGCLSPLLFCLFINSVTTSLKCKYHLYADDLQLYIQTDVDAINCAVAWINEDLRLIESWTKRFGVNVNPDKCQSIIIGSPRIIGRTPYDRLNPILFANTPIPLYSDVKDLGIHLDNNLNWGTQLSMISRRFYATLHSLNNLKNFLPFKAKLMLSYSLLIPLLDYGDVCCVDMTEEQLSVLERLLNMAIRFIFSLRKFDHISEYRAKLNWLPIRLRRNLRCLCLLYAVLNEPYTPNYLKELFPYLDSQHERTLRSSHNLALSVPTHHSSFISRSFAVKSISLWNDLPVPIRHAANRSLFKKQVFAHFMKSQ